MTRERVGDARASAGVTSPNPPWWRFLSARGGKNKGESASSDPPTREIFSAAAAAGANPPAPTDDGTSSAGACAHSDGGPPFVSIGDAVAPSLEVPVTETIRLPRSMFVVLAVALVTQGVALHLMGQPTICTCGVVRIWVGDVLGPENSQQLSDWYSFSHVIHGMIFYGLARLTLPRAPIVAWFALAAGLEVAWELVENSPTMIERYRMQALAQGYSGDAVINSLSDTVMMAIGFAMARLLPVRATVAAALTFEILTAVTIRDDLTLNVIQLVHPVPAIAAWQSGLAPPR